MPELIRSFAARLRRFARDRRHANRRHVRLAVSLAIQDPKTGEVIRSAGALEGYTRDISPGGLSVIVPAIRLGDHYLAGENRVLQITLQLPAGSVLIHAAPVRYHKLDEEETDEAARTHYLIGARIITIGDAERARLVEYLERGDR